MKKHGVHYWPLPADNVVFNTKYGGQKWVEIMPEREKDIIAIADILFPLPEEGPEEVLTV